MLDGLRSWWRSTAALPGPAELRAIDQWQALPTIDQQLLAIQGASDKPWAPLSIREALEVPAVFRAVTLLANLTGALTPVAYRNGAQLALADTPKVITRPDPFRTPRDFYRDTAWNLATRGEAVWYVAARDGAGDPLVLINVPLAELTIEWANRNLGIRSYAWAGVELDPSDVRHITFVCEPGSPRGVGPLQLCGAALSVAAEAAEWAANYFAGGGVPPIVLVPKVPTTPDQAALLQSQWIERAVPGMPRVAAQVEVHPLSVSAESAQLNESRLASRGEVAVMFGMPGHLLEYSAGGSSLTYQNLGAVGDELVRFTLAPNYLEPIEQTLSDLVSRTTAVRFDVQGLMRADHMTRANIYRSALGPATPWLTAAEVRTAEGIEAGGVEYAAIGPNVTRPRLPTGVPSGP
jgi:HK97 family phage portal protein